MESELPKVASPISKAPKTKISSDPPAKISTDPPAKKTYAASAMDGEWTQAKSRSTRAKEAKEASKAKEKEASKADSTPKLPKEMLKERLGKASTDAEKLKVLLKPIRPPEDRTSEVASFTASLPLSKAAQAQPILAWKQVIKTLTGHSPSTVSLFHPCKAELFFDKQVASKVEETLRTAGYLVEEEPKVSERDLARRSEAYLLGYYLPLRRAALRGFSQQQQSALLEMAEKLLPKKYPEAMDRKRWRVQISKDRTWILDSEI
jgi:hypothetical protein